MFEARDADDQDVPLLDGHVNVTSDVKSSSALGGLVTGMAEMVFGTKTEVPSVFRAVQPGCTSHTAETVKAIIGAHYGSNSCHMLTLLGTQLLQHALNIL